jgi:outer membrane biosynthesis protein TonB
MLGFVKNFGKKNNGFYMELKEDAAQPAEAPAPAPAPEAKTPAPAAEPAKAPAKEKKAKAAKAEKAKAASAPAPVPAPAKPQPPAETNFATKYLVPSVSGSNGRRRPGPSMNSYLDMARQAKVPNNGK